MTRSCFQPDLRKFILLAAVTILSPTAGVAEAQAPRKVLGWNLARLLTSDDHRSPDAPNNGIKKGNLKCATEADWFRGSIVVDVKCWHPASPPLNGPHWTKHRLDFEFLSGSTPKDMRTLNRGETFFLKVKATRIDSLGDRCPYGYWVPFFMIDVPGAEGTSRASSYLFEQLKDRPKGVTCFRMTEALKQEMNRDVGRIYPFPMNRDAKTPPYPSEAIYPITLQDKDFDGGVLSIYANAGTSTMGRALPGAWYVYKAVYEGEPWPPGGGEGGIAGKPGTITGGPGTTAGGPGTTGAKPGTTAGGPGTTTGGPGGTPGGGTGTQMTLEAERRKVAAGQTVTVPVWLINGQGLIDMNFNLTYDAAVAQSAGNVVRGNLLAGADFEANPNRAGVVQVGFVPATGGVTAQRGTVAQVPFRAVGQPGSRTVLRIVPRKSSVTGGAPANVATVDGEILIVGPDGRLPGDTDGDGVVGMNDVLNALKMSVELIPVDLVADMDKDGRVTAADARLIREQVLGIQR